MMKINAHKDVFNSSHLFRSHWVIVSEIDQFNQRIEARATHDEHGSNSGENLQIEQLDVDLCC